MSINIIRLKCYFSGFTGLHRTLKKMRSSTLGLTTNSPFQPLGLSQLRKPEGTQLYFDDISGQPGSSGPPAASDLTVFFVFVYILFSSLQTGILSLSLIKMNVAAFKPFFPTATDAHFSHCQQAKDNFHFIKEPFSICSQDNKLPPTGKSAPLTICMVNSSVYCCSTHV